MSVPWPPEPPVQASDPARLWNGQVVPRHVLDMPSGGSFSVDLERAPQTIRELESARDQLIDLRRDVLRLGVIEPGTGDEVSRDAAAVLGAVADGGDGSLMNALDAGVQRLQLLISAVRSELTGYREAEERTADGLPDLWPSMDPVRSRLGAGPRRRVQHERHFRRALDRRRVFRADVRRRWACSQ